MADTIEIQNNVHLEKLLMSDPEMEKRVQGLVRQVIRQARGRLSQTAKGTMKSDPRKAYKAVKSSIYRKLLGGSVSILQKRRAGARGSVPASSRGRRRRTEDLLSYEGADRGFILRFINAGTDTRTVEHINAHGIRRTERTGNRTYKGGIGNRGAIAPRNWFGNNSQKEMERAAAELGALIDDVIEKELNK